MNERAVKLAIKKPCIIYFFDECGEAKSLEFDGSIQDWATDEEELHLTKEDGRDLSIFLSDISFVKSLY